MAEQTDTDIVVQGYSDRYSAAVREVLHTEGGFADDPKDRGGTTNFGISLRFLASEGVFDEDGDGKADFDLDMDGDIDGRDIRQLTRGDAVWLYHRCFWTRYECDSFARPIGEMLFDQAVNGGGGAARKILQRAVNQCLHDAGSGVLAVEVDGRLGAETRLAIDWILQRPAAGMPALIVAFRHQVRERYRAIVAKNPGQQRFLRGWLARAERLGR